MQFEDFDKKIKEAADHHHPAYNEDAWGKMEKLLNKHMPVEKDDRRRFIFFILIPLLLAGGAWLLISKPWSGKKLLAKTEQAAALVKNSANATTSATSDNNDNKTEVPATINEASPTIVPDEATTNTQSPIGNPNAGKLPKQLLNPDITISGTNTNQQFDATVNSPATKKKKARGPLTTTTGKPVEESVVINNPAQTNEVTVKQDESKQMVAVKPVVIEHKDSNNLTTNAPIKSDEQKEEIKISTDKKEQVADAPVTKKEKSGSKKKNSFFISASSGPDISAAGLDRLGKIKIFAGAGLGYTFKDRLTIRTGFYTGRKVYTASPEQYNPGPTFWQYYPYMEKIDAECKVYEIPLLFTYNFGNSKRNWFAGAGVSTYLMKEEIYDYYYKSTPTGQTRHRRWTIDNENKHFFSVMTLSGGYQRNLGNKFMMMAEPFVKIPMGGVGFGNVKLNSAGLMLTVGYKPFNTAKKDKRISLSGNAGAK